MTPEQLEALARSVLEAVLPDRMKWNQQMLNAVGSALERVASEVRQQTMEKRWDAAVAAFWQAIEAPLDWDFAGHYGEDVLPGLAALRNALFPQESSALVCSVQEPAPREQGA